MEKWRFDKDRWGFGGYPILLREKSYPQLKNGQKGIICRVSIGAFLLTSYPLLTGFGEGCILKVI